MRPNNGLLRCDEEAILKKANGTFARIGENAALAEMRLVTIVKVAVGVAQIREVVGCLGTFRIG
jgi:hypothetical protein